jgi:diguanylate cyclase (GGDEF)-like protein
MRKTEKQKDASTHRGWEKRREKNVQSENQNDTTGIKGIRIRKLNYEMVVGSFLVFLIVFYATIEVSRRTQDLVDNVDNYISCEKDAEEVNNGSDYLTEQVQLFVATQETRYMENYFQELDVTKRRELALDKLQKQDTSQETQDYLEKALDYSNELTKTEIYAMKLVAEAKNISEENLPEKIQNQELSETDLELDAQEKMEKAQLLVFGSEYQLMKTQINMNISNFTSNIVSETQEKQEASSKELKYTIVRQRIYISILFIFNILTFYIISVLIVKPLQVYVKCIKERNRLEIMGAYEFKYLALTYNDIYDLNEANRAMLQHKIEHDTLTGVLNRGAFEQLKQVLKVKSIPLALLIVDVDNFKLINDTFGHEVGDKVLKEVAQTLEKSFRGNDYVARIGGDEFGVILTECSSSVAHVINQKVDRINQKLQNQDNDLPCVSLSIGMAFSDSGFSDDLFHNADDALYKVKEHGRCGFCFYNPQLEN